jgi:hypothetical protein
MPDTEGIQSLRKISGIGEAMVRYAASSKEVCARNGAHLGQRAWHETNGSLSRLDRQSRDVAFVAGLMAQRVLFPPKINKRRVRRRSSIIRSD